MEALNTSKALLSILFSVILMTGCGTMGGAGGFRDIKQRGDTIYLKGSIENIQEAAVRALADKRLTSPELEQVPGGVVIYAEQNIVAGMIFNSYGGYGKVTIVSNSSLGAGIVAVSAITRSRAVHEPIGTLEAFKGYNYNNPLLARQILETIKGKVNAKAAD